MGPHCTGTPPDMFKLVDYEARMVGMLSCYFCDGSDIFIPIAVVVLSNNLITQFLQSLPDDNQKIKTPLGGALYAYELPPVPEIQPMTVLEEKGLSSIQRPIPNGGLSQIQRMHHTIASMFL